MSSQSPSSLPLLISSVENEKESEIYFENKSFKI